MKRHLAYLRYVVRHKWFVLQHGLKLGVPLLNLIFHDWTKLLPVEWFAYANTFYKPDGSGQYKPTDAFHRAWNHHQKHNRHHWQYWLLSLDQPDKGWAIQVIDDFYGPFIFAYHNQPLLEFQKPWNGDQAASDDQWQMAKMIRTALNATTALEMPDQDRREMLADWRGAGQALGKTDTLGWYTHNKDFIQLHPNTRAWVEAQLGVSAQIRSDAVR